MEKNIAQLPDIKQTIVLNAPIQKVWETVTTAEGIASWLMPNDFKPEVGHEFHIQSPFGPSPCKVLEIEEPNHVLIQWDLDGWFLSFDLKEVGNQTEFTLVHGGWKEPEAIISKANAPSGVIREHMALGWEKIVHEKLKKVVE